MDFDVFINYLENWRREHNTSQEMMAHYIGITRNQYARIISKKSSFEETRLSTIIGAADFLGKSIDEIVGHKICKDPKAAWWLPGKKK